MSCYKTYFPLSYHTIGLSCFKTIEEGCSYGAPDRRRGLSQRTLSERLETLAVYICRGSISRIEEGRRTVTDIELYGLAQVLGVRVDELFQSR